MRAMIDKLLYTCSIKLIKTVSTIGTNMKNLTLARYLPAFIHTAQTLSFSSAARELGVTPAAVSKAVRNLETQLHARLFHRTTHALTLTDDGERLFSQVGPVAETLENTFASIQNVGHLPQGKLKVTAPNEFGHIFILPLVQPFLQAYPDIELELHLDDRVVDMVQEGYDVGIGNRISEDSSLIARRLTDIEVILVASPSYIARYGMPDEVKAFGERPYVAYKRSSSHQPAAWRYIDEAGETQLFSPSNRVAAVNTLEGLRRLALDGVGVAPISTWTAREELASGRLQQVLPQATTQLAPARIYYASKENLPAKVRVFIDFVVAHFEQLA